MFLSDSVWQLCAKKLKKVQSPRGANDLQQQVGAAASPATCQKQSKDRVKPRDCELLTLISILYLYLHPHLSWLRCSFFCFNCIWAQTFSVQCASVYLPSPVFSSLRCMVISFFSFFLCIYVCWGCCCCCRFARPPKLASFCFFSLFLSLFSKLTFKGVGEVYVWYKWGENKQVCCLTWWNMPHESSPLVKAVYHSLSGTVTHTSCSLLWFLPCPARSLTKFGFRKEPYHHLGMIIPIQARGF